MKPARSNGTRDAHHADGSAASAVNATTLDPLSVARLSDALRSVLAGSQAGLAGSQGAVPGSQGAALRSQAAVALSQAAAVPLSQRAIPLSQGAVHWRAAMRELGIVHRLEQARLLARAARLACESTRLGRTFLALRANADSESEWRRAAAEELDACLFDGWEPHVSLVECASRPAARWLSAGALARAAFALEPGAATRLMLARATLCRGAIESAAQAMIETRADESHGLDERELLESSALCLEASGRWDEALHRYAAASDRCGASPACTQALLALALRVDDIPSADRAWASLGEQRAAMSEPEFVRASALPELCARIRFHRRAGRWNHSPAARSRIETWSRDGRPTAAIALALQ
jgi:hypothetical protein